MSIQMDGRKVGEFQDALLSAYNESSFKQMLYVQLSQDLDELAGPDNFRTRVFDVIMEARRAGWLEQLVKESYQKVPNNPELKAFAISVGVVKTTDAPAGSSEPPERLTLSDLRTVDRLKPVQRSGLRKEMDRAFNVSSLQTICFDMGLEYQNFRSTKMDFINDLIAYCEQHKLLRDLVEVAHGINSTFNWPN